MTRVALRHVNAANPSANELSTSESLTGRFRLRISCRCFIRRRDAKRDVRWRDPVLSGGENTARRIR